jgi:hypothetical protein
MQSWLVYNIDHNAMLPLHTRQLGLKQQCHPCQLSFNFLCGQRPVHSLATYLLPMIWDHVPAPATADTTVKSHEANHADSHVLVSKAAEACCQRHRHSTYHL